MKRLKVNVVIAGRTYPLSVKSTEEEQGLRKAAKDINNLIAKFEENYAVNDKQDVLAMCALQYASKVEIEDIKNKNINSEVLQRIDNLNKLLDCHLE